MEDLRDQFDGVRRFDALSCGFHRPNFHSSNKTRSAALAELCAFFVVSDLTNAQAIPGER
jgi:hypothetical protein